LPVCHAGNALLRIFVLQNRGCGAPACPLKFRRTAKRILVGCEACRLPVPKNFFWHWQPWAAHGRLCRSRLGWGVRLRPIPGGDCWHPLNGYADMTAKILFATTSRMIGMFREISTGRASPPPGCMPPGRKPCHMQMSELFFSTILE